MTPEEVKKRFLCVDCSVDTSVIDEYYMVNDDVWFSSGMGKRDGMLLHWLSRNSYWPKTDTRRFYRSTD